MISVALFVPNDLAAILATMRFFMFVVLCAIADSTATLAGIELNSTLELHSAPQKLRLRGWQPRNLFVRQSMRKRSSAISKVNVADVPQHTVLLRMDIAIPALRTSDVYDDLARFP
jgi:hypothetical protein